MESPPHKRNSDRDEDRISELPDDLLLEIIERLDLPEAVRAGAVSMRWQHLPYRLSRLHLDVCHFQFQGATPLNVMDVFTSAAQTLLYVDPLDECDVADGALKTLALTFYVSYPHLSSIGRTVEDLVSYGDTKCLEFCISPPPAINAAPKLAELGQQFVSFSRAYPTAFQWLTRLTLKNLAFGHSDVTELINACDKLKHLTLSSCSLVNQQSALKIDTPCSGLEKLDLIRFHSEQIEIISLPKLMTVMFSKRCYANLPAVRFGDVPKLRQVSLGYYGKSWQTPLMLSDCLPRSSRNLSKLKLDFFSRTIWIQPEQSKQLTFRNLGNVYLFGIFPECDLSWTLFILEAAPALQKLKMLTMNKDKAFGVVFKTFKRECRTWHFDLALEDLKMVFWRLGDVKDAMMIPTLK